MLSWQVGRVKITRIVEMDLPVPAQGPAAGHARGAAQVGVALSALRQRGRRHPEAQHPRAAGRGAGAEAGGRHLRRQRPAARDHRRRAAVDAVPAASWRGRLVARRQSTPWCARTCTSTTSAGTPCSRTASGRRPSRRRATSSAGASTSSGAPTMTQEQQAMLGDSVKPIFDAGLAELVELDHVISPEIRLDALHRPHAGPRQRDDRVRGRAGGDHRRHGPPPLPAGAPRLVARRQRPEGRRAHPLAPLRRMGRPADPRHRHPLRRPHRRPRRPRRRSVQVCGVREAPWL